ncbi:potassium channel family protein [Candidatus Contubernalis alkaliaceticus]|uniref:potassium channel family protein n=1 Tax=Candidatus Contubernalis alkaliaceticus TaxID=338645 RepID=UPI001F4BCF8F|nr:NAD-binding protein [Candidatus Contubernalis alkalaceticus]UNC91143.1 NAD-binding protein [Candidatus Contubernalis alkalaceticus]
MKSLKDLFFPQKQMEHFDGTEAQYFRVADYTKRLLYRILFLAVLWILILIPVVKKFMLIFEGREITAGQAAIFIFQTITTTGYGELLPFHSFPMVMISILLMISGVFLIFMTAGTLMASLIESRITPRAPTFTNQAGHVVFTSYNETVARTITLLESCHIPYVVAAREQIEAVELMRRGIQSICADPRYNEGLKKLNIENARLVVAVNEDTENINITLGISNISDTLILAVMENENRAELAYAAGAHYVVPLEEELGRQLVDWICADASPTSFLELLNVEVPSEIVAQLKPSIIHVGADSEFSGKTIGDAKLRTETGATIAAIWEEDGTISPPSPSSLLNESTLLVLGPHDNVDRLASLMGGPGPGEHVVVIGGGKVGQEAGKRLNDTGIEPHVIDIKRRPLYFRGKLVVGDATKPHVLQEVNIDKANTLIVTINDDSLNIFSVLAARQINPHINIMARAIHVDAIERQRQAGSNHVLSESMLGFQLLQIAMVKMGVLPKLSNYVVREVTWKGEPVTIQELAIKNSENFKIICIVENNKAMEPSLNYSLQKGSRLVILGSPEHIDHLF